MYICTYLNMHVHTMYCVHATVCPLCWHMKCIHIMYMDCILYIHCMYIHHIGVAVSMCAEINLYTPVICAQV